MFVSHIRNSRSSALTAVTIVFIFLFAGLVYNHLGAWDTIPTGPARVPTPSLQPAVSFQSSKGTEKQLVDIYFNQLQKPSVNVDAPTYRPWGAFPWHQANSTFWSKPLGQKMCIIDLDNRKFNETGQLFGPEAMSWKDKDQVHGLSMGILNHWLYAKIHGYKYYYIDIENPKDRRSSWKKPSVISKILKKHNACIYLDSDAVFYNLDLPFEWLMNYWGLNPVSNSLALAADPDREFNEDEKGKINLNTGFIVAQNNKKTYEIMDAWDHCSDEGGKYPGCEKYRLNDPGRPTDQGGFGSYVRYDFPDDIKELPCDEANGFPEAHTGCDGKFIRHLWTGKDDFIKIVAGNQMPGPYLEMFHREFLTTMKSFHMTEAKLMSS